MKKPIVEKPEMISTSPAPGVRMLNKIHFWRGKHTNESFNARKQHFNKFRIFLANFHIRVLFRLFKCF